MSATVKTRELTRNNQVDEMHYDASEEESVFEQDMRVESKVMMERAFPILDAQQTQRQQRSVNESTWKTWPGKHTLCPRPVMTGYSISDDEELEMNADATRGKRKTRVVKPRASWPRMPSTPKAHDSGVQGLDDSETDSGSADGKMRTRKTERRREPDVLALAQIEGGSEDEGVMFRGIADQDSSEERWRQIMLEEHLDRIFNAVPKLPGEEGRGEMVQDAMVVRGSFESDDWGGTPRKYNWKEKVLMMVKYFACGWRSKKGRE